jgi:hypothetical protein
VQHATGPARSDLTIGTRLWDPLLVATKPRNETWLIFGLVYFSLVVGLAVLVFHARALVIGVQAYIVMVFSRIVVMYFAVFDPPTDMIPLRDPLIGLLGTNRLLTRDLFFSGHTSTLFLLTLAVPVRRCKPLFLACTICVAVGVLQQHVHYTIDVLVAPLFAFVRYRVVKAAHERVARPMARR